jgi:hypothetical protein
MQEQFKLMRKQWEMSWILIVAITQQPTLVSSPQIFPLTVYYVARTWKMIKRGVDPIATTNYLLRAACASKVVCATYRVLNICITTTINHNKFNELYYSNINE